MTDKDEPKQLCGEMHPFQDIPCLKEKGHDGSPLNERYHRAEREHPLWHGAMNVHIWADDSSWIIGDESAKRSTS
jgi:hypothetical protein